MIKRIAIIGTGLIGASIGLALRRAGFPGEILGIDRSELERTAALDIHAIDRFIEADPNELKQLDAIILSVPVLGVLDWMQRLAPHLHAGQLITDVGSTKLAITRAAAALFPPGADAPTFLPGHPMAGKESGGAALADATLFEGATWLFTPGSPATSALETEWRTWVTRFGAHPLDMDAARHDKLCAWVSHLPQMVSTAMAALFEDEFGDAEEIAAVGGRALREMTRLGASPYSMWRDVALTNTDAVAATLFALEQRLAHIRENLKTPELRDEFAKANHFRAKR